MMRYVKRRIRKRARASVIFSIYRLTPSKVRAKTVNSSVIGAPERIRGARARARSAARPRRLSLRNGAFFLHAQNPRHTPLHLRHRTNVPCYFRAGNAVRLREKLIHKSLRIEVASGPDLFSWNVRSSLFSRLFFRLLSPTEPRRDCFQSSDSAFSNGGCYGAITLTRECSRSPRGDGHVLVITVTGADAPGRSGAEARAAAAGRANSEAARTHRKAAGTEPGDGQAR